MENETIDIYSVSLVIADIPDMTDSSPQGVKIYKNYIFSVLCSIYRLLKTGGHVVIFCNLDYMPWIGKELKEFNVLSFKGPIIFDSEGKDIVKSRYHICYWLQEENLKFDVQKPKKHNIQSADTSKESFIDNLIVKYTNLGDTVLNCFESDKEMTRICNKHGRKCRTIPLMNDKGK